MKGRGGHREIGEARELERSEPSQRFRECCEWDYEGLGPDQNAGVSLLWFLLLKTSVERDAKELNPFLEGWAFCPSPVSLSKVKQLCSRGERGWVLSGSYCSALLAILHPCLREKTCNGCGKSGHMYKGCPDRRRTFAEVASEAGGVEVAVSGRGSTGQQRTGNEVPEERVKELRVADHVLRVGEVEVLLFPATAGPSGLQTKGKRAVEGGELGSHGPAVESLDGQVRTSPRQVGAATSKEQMRRDSQSSLNDGKGQPHLTGGQKSTKRIKGFTLTKEVGGGSVDEQGRVDSCIIVPETAPTLGDTAIEIFGLDFTFSPDMLSLPLLRGPEQEEMAVQQDGTRVSSCSWAEQMVSMEVYEERRLARSEDG
ncbi:hypothetical protein Q5P01_016545 [Channa striata]|uniref:CCHC-type domain-containing protein n=1 Tax=Channa striata TaxID=64152 RepID=A0AA88SCK6_CHASR|nr:hypothetical protein Q5P01_016545 [Channa striata]